VTHITRVTCISQVTHMIHKSLTILTVAILAACGIGAALAQERKAASQKTFDSPEAAVKALIDATSKNDSAELTAVLGSNGQGILTSGDANQDQAERREFAQLATARHRLERSAMKAGTMILVVGQQDWPFPVPLVSAGQHWHFDPELGALEVRARRVGANELDAIEICSGYVEAQQAYAAQHRSGAATMEYAKAIMSAPGQKDGLYQAGASSELVPQGFADAAVETPGHKAKPYHGYYFRVLREQGPNAPGGPHKYVAGKYMIGGFALVAWPADYGVSGVHTFIVNQDSLVYEKDLGPQTSTLAPGLVRYDPDRSWSPVD
jgi:hypothetical protein